jgi:hypothetical protein
MKAVEVRKLRFADTIPGLDNISAELDSKCVRYPVDIVNWKDFDYKPTVSFSAGYTLHEIFLKYYVTERWFRAEKTEPNSAVYEDSCVEFFVAPADDGLYYNFEFNALGTCLLGIGKGRENRIHADSSVISMIRRNGSAGASPIGEQPGEFTWDLLIGIPVDSFFKHKITGLSGKTFRANFYKCGDKLRVPHYLSWNPVVTDKPDYHRPEYFGLMKFI